VKRCISPDVSPQMLQYNCVILLTLWARGQIHDAQPHCSFIHIKNMFLEFHRNHQAFLGCGNSEDFCSNDCSSVSKLYPKTDVSMPVMTSDTNWVILTFLKTMTHKSHFTFVHPFTTAEQIWQMFCTFRSLIKCVDSVDKVYFWTNCEQRYLSWWLNTQIISSMPLPYNFPDIHVNKS